VNFIQCMWVRYDADRPQFMRAVITGPTGTPYESGVFVFDLFFPLDYPQVPPKVRLVHWPRFR
jgi:ubiquitin-protein ligase